MKRLATMLGCVLTLGLGITACDGEEPMVEDDAGPLEDGGETMVDSGPMESGDPVGTGADLDSLSPADYSCLGERMAPTGGADVEFTGTVADFFNSMPVEGLTVQFFPDNMAALDGTCTGTCVEAVSGADGSVTLTGPEGGWYAYRVEGGTGMQDGSPAEYIDVIQSNNVAPGAGGTENLIAVQVSTRSTITTLLGLTFQEGTATITGQVTDCAGATVANATVRLFDASGEIALDGARTEPNDFYFNGSSTPLARQEATHVDGLYGATNIATSADPSVRVEIWGTLEAGGEPQLLGCETTQALGDGISVVNIPPLRADAPAGCGG